MSIILSGSVFQAVKHELLGREPSIMTQIISRKSSMLLITSHYNPSIKQADMLLYLSLYLSLPEPRELSTLPDSIFFFFFYKPNIQLTCTFIQPLEPGRKQIFLMLSFLICEMGGK